MVVRTRRAYWCHPQPSSGPLHCGHASCGKQKRSAADHSRSDYCRCSRGKCTYPFSIPQVLHSQQVQQVNAAVVMTERFWVQIIQK